MNLKETLSVKDLKELRNHYSPTIPEQFPKSQLPTQLCQRTLLDVMTCMEHFGPPDKCGPTVLKYYNCKKVRDSVIFSKIKKWERNLFTKLESKEDRVVYLQDLQKKKEEIKERLQVSPVEVQTSHLNYRMKSDIEQLEWRVGYLSNLM